MSKFFCCVTAFILLATPSFAKSWQIDQKNSAIEFSGTHIDDDFNGNFSEFGGKIEFDPKNLSKSFAKIKINLLSAKTNNKSHDKTLQQSDWLDSKKEKFATYETKKISKIQNNEYQIDGFLTIKNIKMTHNFKAVIKIDKNKAYLKAITEIKRLDFNIGKSSDASGDWISPIIYVKIKINATL